MEGWCWSGIQSGMEGGRGQGGREAHWEAEREGMKPNPVYTFIEYS